MGILKMSGFRDSLITKIMLNWINYFCSYFLAHKLIVNLSVNLKSLSVLF